MIDVNLAADIPAKHADTLVAGIGNIFLGDDGFGCAVARELAGMSLPVGTKVVDYGIRGLDLAYALLDPYETVIFVDAISRGEAPGTIYLLQPVRPGEDGEAALDPHSMDPVHLMAMARSLGEIRAEILIVGCEPLDFGDEIEGRMELSPAVAAAVPEAARMVLELIQRGRSGARVEAREPALASP
ncbi:MAG TPA: hydrogenase maturation protease [Acidobacteriaceae bacterium]